MSLEESIIDLVRDTPWLYDKKYENYKNAAAKKEKWNEISSYLLDMFNVQISPADLEKRWNSMRDMFSREHRKQTLTISSGSSRANRKEWPLYRNMIFLAPFIAQRKLYHGRCTVQRKKQPHKTMSPEEIIIDLVRDTPWLYDKKHENYKNTAAKKEKWNEISSYLLDVCDVQITPADLEKRWNSLRDMFGREQRKQTLPIPSGSGRTNRKEWPLYRNMIFLAPFIARRTSKSSLQLLSRQSGYNGEQCDEDDVDGQMSQYEHTERRYDSVDKSDPNHIRAMSTGAPSNCSSTSNISRFCSVTLISDENSKKFEEDKRKIIPFNDEFVERKRENDEKLEEKLVEASTAISQAASTMSLYLEKQTEEKYDGYMMAIKEGLVYVPPDKKTECLIEVLKVIKLYEQRT